MEKYDVVAVEIETSTVLWVEGPQDADNAEAVIKMAIMRQGVEDRFFSAAQVGQYKKGDTFSGGVSLPVKEEGRIIVRGGMAFPNGPRGLQR